MAMRASSKPVCDWLTFKLHILNSFNFDTPVLVLTGLKTWDSESLLKEML